MTTTTIRPAEERDVPALTAIYNHYIATTPITFDVDPWTVEARLAWLRKLMAGSWRDATPELAAWREHCIATVAAIPRDTVIFSHYVAINVIAGAATADDRVIVFSPDNCSVTVLETDGTKVRLVEKGSEASLTKVN